ncbi:relaxase/mobilization nuclease domain-containing protein [Flavobacterium bizetiae]|uniref:relaxase/mobilization nuclease domain-containing protein n=1 Tax=Flavobacterium bizetiae TaxID=2704140 RepID=UPI003757EAB4
MVTIIKMSHSIASILTYNENKVKTGAGQCIKAANFPLELEKLTFALKLNRFLNRAKLNEITKRNTVHISLNFHPLDNLSKEVLIEVADTYMEKIGFSKQPYLIYQHHDAGHPHLHIITTNIQRDGKRIDLHLLVVKKSEPARKEIEKVFGLVRAEGRKNKEAFSLDPIPTSKVRYGKIASMKAISNVLNRVLNTYKYCNLQDLNAVLKQYNVMADPGKEDSKMFTSKGLLYRILDEKGNTVGVPIKASNFYLQPTLKFLEEKFQNNTIIQSSDITSLKSSIEKVFIKTNYLSLNDFTIQLEKAGINTILTKNRQGILQSITYIDHKTHNVFSESALGERYSLRSIEEHYLLKTSNRTTIHKSEQKAKKI